jgi:outer membrane biosynthesis protein TonB
MIFSREKLFALKKALLRLGSVSTEDGTTLVYDNDVLEVGNEVFVDGDEGLTPAPDKDYIYDDKVISVEGGVVIAIVAKPVEQEETEETTEEEVTEEVTEETTEETEEETTEEEVTEEEVTEEETTEETEETTEETTEEEMPEEPTVDELKAVIDEQKSVIEDLNRQIEELKKQLEEPAAAPAEEEFKNQKPTETSKIDFSRYIKKTNKNI